MCPYCCAPGTVMATVYPCPLEHQFPIHTITLYKLEYARWKMNQTVLSVIVNKISHQRFYHGGISNCCSCWQDAMFSVVNLYNHIKFNGFPLLKELLTKYRTAESRSAQIIKDRHWAKFKSESALFCYKKLLELKRNIV